MAGLCEGDSEPPGSLKAIQGGGASAADGSTNEDKLQRRRENGGGEEEEDISWRVSSQRAKADQPTASFTFTCLGRGA
ncbi:hypothetical protein ANN_04463 [Periplaneta americana]|uniref:Uncharacterized protein n=1 Tax=Periplaneta americana TaxID=6978 RepID=A0ABQ8T8N3_PERAM|nr:hypothetical protein ANN_04463 [Periplaneta americana]